MTRPQSPETENRAGEHRSLQQEALEEFQRIAREEGIDLARKSTCYPPTCRMHEHADGEKRRFATFAARISASTKKSTKPRREEKERGS